MTEAFAPGVSGGENEPGSLGTWQWRHPTGVVVAASVVLVVLRGLLAVSRYGPVLLADEVGYLGNARTLAGGRDVIMGSSPFYRAGYSLVLLPVVGLVSAPETAYRAALAVNALLAAAVLPLLYLLLRSVFGAPARVAAGAAIVGAVYPSVTTLARVAMAENLLFPLAVLWLLLAGYTMQWRGRRQTLAGAGFGATGAMMWTAHGRMIVLVALSAALIGWALRRRFLSAATAAVAMATMAGGLLLGRALNAAVAARNWRDGHPDELGRVLGGLDGVEGWLWVGRNLAGHVWYVSVATFGLVWLVMRLRRRDPEQAQAGRDALLLLPLVAALGLLVLSAVWFHSPTRPDQMLYGRYVEPLVPVLVALGVVGLTTRPPRVGGLRVAGVLAGLGVVVAALRWGVSFEEGASRWNVAAMPFRAGPPIGAAGILGGTAIGVLGMLVLARAAPRGVVVAAAAGLGLFAPTILYNEVSVVRDSTGQKYGAAWVDPRPVVDAVAGSVAYDLAAFEPKAVKIYQWFLPSTDLVFFDSRRGEPFPGLYFGAPDTKPEPRALVLWRDAVRPVVLWCRPALVRCPAAAGVAAGTAVDP